MFFHKKTFSLFQELYTSRFQDVLNYFIYNIAILVSFIPTIVFSIKNDFIVLLIFLFVQFSITCLLFRIKRFRNGFPFLKSIENNEFFNISFLIISMIILLTFIFFVHYKSTPDILWSLFISAIVMFITIKKSITLYYKHNLLVDELNKTKSKLKDKELEVISLEKENLDYGKKIHTINHEQRILAYKLSKLSSDSEIAEELDIRKNKVV